MRKFSWLNKFGIAFLLMSLCTISGGKAYAATASSAKAKVKWTNPAPTVTAPAATSIIVEHALNATTGPWDTTSGCTTTGTATECTTPDLTGGMSHFFRVKACNAVGCQDPSAPVEANLNLPGPRGGVSVEVIVNVTVTTPAPVQ